MPDSTRVEVIIGGSNAQAKEAILETKQEIADLAKVASKGGKEGGEKLGEGLVHGLRHNLKHIRKEAGLMAIYVGQFMGSEAAAGFKGSLKEGISGAMGGLFFGAQFGGPVGAGIGALLGAGIGIAAGAIKDYQEMKKTVKELNQEMFVTDTAAKGFFEAMKSSDHGEEFKKNFKEYIALLEEFRIGSDKAKVALNSILGSSNKSSTNIEELQRLVKTIDALKSPVEQLKKLKLLPGGEQGFKDMKEVLAQIEENKKKEFGPQTGVMFGGGGQVSRELTASEKEDIESKQINERLQEKLKEHQTSRAARENEAEKQSAEVGLKAQEEYSDKLTKAQDDYNSALEESLANDKNLNTQLTYLLTKQSKLKEEALWISDNADLVLENKKEQLSIDDKILETHKKIAEQTVKRKEEQEKLANISLKIQEEQQKLKPQNQGAGFTVKELAGIGGFKVPEITGPMTRQGAFNIRLAREAELAEGWAKRFNLEGRSDLAENRLSYARGIKERLRGVVQDSELDVQKNIFQELKILNESLENGKAMVRAKVANGE